MELTKAGLDVAMLEAGSKTTPDQFSEHVQPWEMKYRDRHPGGLTSPEVARTRPMHAKQGACSETNYRWFVNDIENPFTTPKDKPFVWVRVRALGGRSLAQVATWPDEIRSDPSWDCAKPFHFVTKPLDEPYPGKQAVERIDELRPDLLFLDVQMPELTGIEVLERVQHQPAVVFTTAFDRYAVAAFELEAIDYLIKPFGKKRFGTTLERVQRRLIADQQEPEGNRLCSSQRGEIRVRRGGKQDQRQGQLGEGSQALTIDTEIKQTEDVRTAQEAHDDIHQRAIDGCPLQS